MTSEERPDGEFRAADPAGSAVRHGLGGGTLIILALIIALASALIGGVVGGYVGYRAGSSTTSGPDYNAGPLPPAVTSRSRTSVAGIAARILPGVVMIKVNGTAGTGSGFVIQGGYVVTNNHVVTLDGQVRSGTASLQVVFNDGQAAPGRLVGADPYSDIAVIQPRGISRLAALRLGNSAGVEVGDPVIAIGSPLGLAGTVTSGIVSAVNRPVQPGDVTGAAAQAYINAIQTDAAINPGNSGGPLVNGEGQVIGVTAAIASIGGNLLGGGQSGSIGLGFAIPIDQVRLVAQQLIRTGKAAHPVIGALIDTQYTGSGAEIVTSDKGGSPPVTPGGPAARAGLRPGDVIVDFAGAAIQNASALLQEIRTRLPGDRVPVVFDRHGTRHTVTLTVGSSTS
jgi:putative serine protease PepD